MMVAMVLAHLVGDYVLQWDTLAYWKSRALKGVLVHGAIVTAVTALFALPLDVSFWPWVVFIGGLHMAVDAAPLWLIPRLGLRREGLFELARWVLDQTLHFTIIALALMGAGYLNPGALWADLTAALNADRWLVFVLAYVFAAMPAWITVEFVVYGLVNGSAPDFATVKHYKYVGTLERWLMMTFVLLGQFAMVPLAVLPRLVFEGVRVMGTPRSTVYLAELLFSVTLAVALGLALRAL
jgi:hypothetical protein